MALGFWKEKEVVLVNRTLRGISILSLMIASLMAMVIFPTNLSAGVTIAQVSPIWTLLISDGDLNAPSQRAIHGAVWDEQASRMLVFGGSDNSNQNRNDLWQ